MSFEHPLKKTQDDPANLSTRYDMQAEASAFMNRGLSEIDACHLVGLQRRDFYRVSGSALPFVPTPAEIAAITQRMRDGDRVCSAGSQQRWIAENQKVDAAGTDTDRFDLAGRIADDDCPVPVWLYSADKPPGPTTEGIR